MRKIGEFLLAKNRNAIIVAFIAALLPLIYLPGGFIASIVVGLVTLRKGAKDGLMVLAWVALPAIAVLFLRQFNVFDILLLRCVLVWFFATILRRYQSWQLVLEIAAVLGLIAVILFHLVIPDMKGWWSNILTHYFKQMGMTTAWKISATELQNLVGRVAPIATGLITFWILLMSFLELILARWWEALMYNPGGLQKEFINIRVGRLLAVIGALILLGLLLKVTFAMDLMPVIVLPFMIAGLSLLHLMVTKKKMLLWVLILMYVGFLFLPVIFISILALIGFVDSLYDFRRRLIHLI